MATFGHAGVADRRVLAPSDTDDFLFSTSSTELPLLVVFPSELWLEIIGHIKDVSTLSVLMRVNRAFRDIAEIDLYHTITMDHDSVILRFCTCISRTPHHAALVTRLHLPAIGEQILRDNQRLFLSTLGSLRNLDYLSLHLLGGLEHNPAFGAAFSKGAVGLRFPRLRGFSTNLLVYVLSLGPAFFQAHPSLADLEIAVDTFGLMRLDAPPQVQLGALRTLASGAWFLLQDRFTVPATLTHYHARDLDLESTEFPSIARLLGTQLVALRISERFVYEHRGGGHAVALDELLRLFPRLRFLQLDVHIVPEPYISTRFVNCTAARPQSAFGMAQDRRPRLTLAWVCVRRPWSTRVRVEVAPIVWDEFLRATALRVLQGWGDCVKRIMYRNVGAPWTSVSLREGAGADGAGPVYREETGMQDELWKLV